MKKIILCFSWIFSMNMCSLMAMDRLCSVADSSSSEISSQDGSGLDDLDNEAEQWIQRQCFGRIIPCTVRTTASCCCMSSAALFICLRKLLCYCWNIPIDSDRYVEF